MPVARERRRVHASLDDLNRWLGRESAGEPVQIATESADLSSELKRDGEKKPRFGHCGVPWDVAVFSDSAASGGLVWQAGNWHLSWVSDRWQA